MGKVVLIIFFFVLSSVVLGRPIRYEIRVKEKIAIKSREYLYSFVGVEEKGANRGVMIDEMNRCIGNPLGSPYCQAGQYYCYYKAYAFYGFDYPNYPIPKNGLAISTFNLAKKNGKLAKKYFATTDDFVVWKARNSAFGHIERVIENEGKGWVKTIGFNVSLRKGKEGVAIKRRNILFPLNQIKNILGVVGVIKEK